MQESASCLGSSYDSDRCEFRGRSRAFAAASAAGHVGSVVRALQNDRTDSRATRERACGPREGSQAQHRREPDDRVALQRSQHSDAAGVEGWARGRSTGRRVSEARDSAQSAGGDLSSECRTTHRRGGIRLNHSGRTRLAFLLALLAIAPTVFAQEPPRETGTFRKPDLVELIKLDRTIKLDIRYATSNNFLGRPVYKEARAFLQRPAAEALVRVNKALRIKGYGLIIHDGYRPWSVTKIFWDATPADKKEFVADPSQGSRHNRGCAVDLSLFDLKTGKVVVMPSGYDEMTERSHINYTGGTDEQRRLRDILRAAMEAEGFAVYEPEWWHYDYKDWKEYPILNLEFPAIRR